jgi:hypothetical protein
MNPLRVRSMSSHPARADGDFVLYWMTAYRRPRWNHSLDRALEHATSPYTSATGEEKIEEREKLLEMPCFSGV